MAFYLGSNKVFIYPNSAAWWGIEKNPKFLYEANYNCKLSETTDWATFSETYSTTNRTIRYAPTTYTTAANANVIFDRWGYSYNTDGDTSKQLDFENYDYFVLSDTIINLAYKKDENELGYHQVRSVRTSLFPIHKSIIISNNQIVNSSVSTPTTTICGTTVNYMYSLFKNASNNLVLYNGGYGLYCNAAAPSLQNTTKIESQFINFRTPSLLIRGNTTYLTQDVFNEIDGNNTEIMTKQRLYQIGKSSIEQQTYQRIGLMLTSGEFLNESI